MKISALSTAALLGALWLATTAWSGQNPVPTPRLLNAELLARGKTVYNNHCAGCHGTNGDGHGPGAYGLAPKPRDFTTGTFKFRSTPTGKLPTDEDLARSVRQGIPGTSMPAFDLMAERDLLAVAQYLKTFSEEWTKPENFSAPLHIPRPPGWFYEDAERPLRIAKGAQFYQMSCAVCHGDKGDGRGFAAPSLFDSWQHPVPPADLRKPYVRSGRSLSDLYKALVTGINGTPMPSFSENTTEDQRWELVAFIADLRRQRSGLPAEYIPPASASGAIPSEPDSDATTEYE